MRRLFAMPDDRLFELSGGAMQEKAPAIEDLPAFLAQNEAIIPRVLHLDWCICSVHEFKVLESAHAIVDPGISIDATTTENTKIS